jgi:cobyrinic acid a,c-diamide synthase
LELSKTENIEALENLNAKVIFFSPLSDRFPAKIDALYIGGGFPETHAAQLAGNTEFKAQLKHSAEGGLPIYAECGGLMYLGEELVLDEKTYPMVGLLPVAFGFSKKPQGHGYTIIEVERDNPYFKTGTELKGHEFHYSKVLKWHGKDEDLVFAVKRGAGLYNHRDGIVYKNVLATYTHIHALGSPFWARALVKKALSFRQRS